MHKAYPSCGQTIHASHIEEPRTNFFVEWHSPAYVNVLHFNECIRWARVLARTPEGALKIAKYHYYTGDNFRLMSAEPMGVCPREVSAL